MRILFLCAQLAVTVSMLGAIYAAKAIGSILNPLLYKELPPLIGVKGEVSELLGYCLALAVAKVSYSMAASSLVLKPMLKSWGIAIGACYLAIAWASFHDATLYFESLYAMALSSIEVSPQEVDQAFNENFWWPFFFLKVTFVAEVIGAILVCIQWKGLVLNCRYGILGICTGLMLFSCLVLCWPLWIIHGDLANVIVLIPTDPAPLLWYRP